MSHPVALLAAALLAGAVPAPAEGGRRGGGRGAGRTAATVVLDGAPVPVRWSDGDSFRILGGPRAGVRARLEGVNALETYGPVHRIGAAEPAALLVVARRAAAVAAAAGGGCAAAGRLDRYGRLLVTCPEASAALVRTGHALVFAVDGPPDPALLALQAEAQRARAGLWAGGAPPLVPTSLHSVAEAGGGQASDRVVDTRTGVTALRPHRRAYAACDELCVGEGPDRACLVYVPYDRRYRDRPACLRR